MSSASTVSQSWRVLPLGRVVWGILGCVSKQHLGVAGRMGRNQMRRRREEGRKRTDHPEGRNHLHGQ